MLHDPERIAEVRSWFSRAAEDLRAATFELTAEPPLTADIVFHAQQAVEKAIKGFLSWHDRPFRKTHNLVEFGEAATAVDPALEPGLRRAAPLTECAWRHRRLGSCAWGGASPRRGENTNPAPTVEWALPRVRDGQRSVA